VEIFGIGFLAGLALAIPLGPMAMLLIVTTLNKGRKVAGVATFAMASVDFSYAFLVFMLGDLVVSSLAQWLLPLRIAGSLLLIFVAVRIAISARKTQAEGIGAKEVNTKSALVTFGTFFGLTVINPATAFYFVGITPSLSAISGTNAWLDASSFAAGIFLGSIIWQWVLVLGSHLISKSINKKFQQRLQYVGAILIIGMAIWLLLR